MKIEISAKDAALVLGGLAAGVAMTCLGIKKAKQQIAKEIVSEKTNEMKKEIINDIKEEINTKKVVEEIKNDINKTVVDDILKQSTDNMNKFITIVNGKLNDFEKKLNEAIDTALNIEKRVGKIVGNLVAKFIKGGDDYEIEI